MMNETKTGTYFYNDESYNFNFVTNLSASDKAIFVRTVVDTIVDDNNYDSVLRDVIFNYTIINMLTDIDISFLKEVDEYGGIITNIDLLEDFLFETNIVEVVKANAFPTLFDELNNAVDKSIEYRTGIHSSPLNEALTSLVNTLERKMEEFDMSGAMEMMEAFNGISGDLTPENIVKTYMDTSIAKKNAIEVEESKKNKAAIVEKVAESFEEFKHKK